MPDDDRFGLRINRAWRRVRESLARQDPLERTEDAVASAVAMSLRRSGGVPDLADIAAEMQERAINDKPVGAHPREHGGYTSRVLTRLAQEAAATLAETYKSELKLISPGKAAE